MESQFWYMKQVAGLSLRGFSLFFLAVLSWFWFRRRVTRVVVLSRYREFQMNRNRQIISSKNFPNVMPMVEPCEQLS